MSEITYELNPPKIVKGERFDFEQLRLDLQAIIDKASRLSSLADSIHMTDSVLGIPRVSGITAAGYIRQELPEARISCSLRTRDRNFSALSQSVADAIFCGVERLLILLGDEPQDSPGNCGIKPSAAVRMFRKEGYDSNMRLDLSFPAKILKKDAPAIQSKLDASPDSIVTQSIASLEDLGEIVDLAKGRGIEVSACIMVPCEKNRLSASIIGLDWSAYEKDPVDFVKQAAKIADRVLLTSPNSFADGLDLLSTLCQENRH